MKRFAMVVAMVLICAGLAEASDPVGIYAIVDKVVFEPSDGTPERIQIWGTFAFAKAQSRDDYEEPVRGFVYYALPKGKEDVARKEWADLKKIAGTAQCVAFASRYEKQGKLRKATDKAESPDAYAIGFGLQKISEQSGMAKKLREAKAKDSKDKGAK